MDCRVKPGNDSGEAIHAHHALGVMPGLDPAIHYARQHRWALRNGNVVDRRPWMPACGTERDEDPEINQSFRRRTVARAR